jgi:hypothetical protein
MATVLATGQFTLSPNVTQTTVVAANCTPASAVMFSPMTQHAANDVPAASVVAGNGQFVLTHASNPRTDRMFGFTVFG